MNIETIYEGKIGVNNLSPQHPLDVSGSVNITGNLSVDTNTLFVDASNNRVGVGTTAPSTALEIKQLNSIGTELGYIQMAPNPSYDSSIKMFRDISTSYGSGIGRIAYFCRDLSNNPTREVARIQAVPRGPPSDFTNLFRRGDLEIGVCNVSIPNGNLGIGVTDVSSSSIKLALGPISTSSVDTYMSINANNPIGNTGIIFNDTNVEKWRIRVDNSNNDSFFIQDQSTNRVLSLLQNGNVGINQINPTATLDVSGDMQTNGNMIMTGSESTRQSIIMNPGSQAASLVIARQGVFINNVKDYIAPYTSNNAGGGCQLSFGTGDMTFSNFPDSSLNNPISLTERMRITKTGNVGIGTTNPSSKLTVNSDDANAAISINRYNKDGPAYLYFGATDGSEGVPTSVTGNRTIGFTDYRAYDGSKFIGSVAAVAANVDTGSVGSNNMPGNLRFYTRAPNNVIDNSLAVLNSFERIRITSGGNVGIGTTTPSSTLDVSGTGRISGNFSVDTSSFFVNTLNKYVGIGTNNPNYPVEVIGEGTGKAQMRVRTNNPNSSIDAGILLIGVTDDVSANRRSSIVLDPTGANGIGGDYLYIEAKGDGSTQISNQNNAPLSLQTNKLDRVTILGNGNVGIGTNTPQAKLDISGGLFPLKIQPTGSLTDGVSLTMGYNGISYNSTAPSYKTFTIRNQLDDANADTYLLGGSGQGITIKNTGNVGIGTTTPQAKLDVATGIDGLSAIFSSANGANNFNSVQLRGGTIGSSVNWQISKDRTLGNSLQIARSTTNGGTTFETPIFTIKNDVSGTARVGIGNDNPLSTLVVGNSMGSGYGATIDSSGSQFGTIVRTYSTTPSTDNNASLWVRNVNTTTSTDTTLFRVNNNGNVGIGVPTPLTILDISYNSSDTSFNTQIPNGLRIYNTNTTSGAIGLLSFSASQTGTAIGGVGVVNTPVGGSAANLGRLALYTKPTGTSFLTEKMTILGDGNVGIGTSAPSTTLDVSGTGRISGNFTVDTDTLFVDASNNRVGVGTITPTEKLNINGGNLFMNGSFNGMVMNPGAGAGSLVITRGGEFTNNVTGFADASGYRDNIGGASGGGAQISLLKNEMSFSTFPTTATAGTPITLTERMRLTATGLGINTTTPSYKLQVEGSGTANEIVGWFNNQGAFSSSIAVRQSAKTAYITNHSGTGTPNYDDQLANAISFGVSSGASPIQFWNGNTGVGLRGTAKMTILDGSGNVGIGTNAPTFQLQLSRDSAGKPTSNTWSISSDQRVKTNIENADLDRCNEIVENLSLKRFQWSEKYFPNVDDRNSIGFIAQEVEQYFPNAVKTHKNKFLLQKGETEEENIYEEIEDFKSLDIDQLIKCLFGSVKYLQNQVKTLVQKNETLEQRIAKLE